MMRIAEVLRKVPTRVVAVAAGIAIIGPVLWFGPWLPLIDLVAFVGMDSYPAAQSYGPFHYSVFQFSYFGHYVISRLLCDLSLPIPYQIPFFYLLQAGVSFVVVWRCLERIVTNVWLRSVGIALGALAYWDGVFLWGGPLAYSLGASSLTLATFFAVRGIIEPDRDHALPLALAMLFAICCHPFAAPFALVLCGVRWLFNRRRRWQTLVLASVVIVYAIVIVRDSPASEATASGNLHRLFGWDWAQFKQRIVGLFTQDAVFVETLFGTVPLSARIVFAAMAGVHVAGFVLAPWLIWRAKDRSWLRVLATLNAATALLYLFSYDLPTGPIPEWPQRILTLYSAFTYITGFGGIAYLLERRWAWRGAVPRWPATAWAMPCALLLLVAWAEARVFRFAPRLERAVASVKRDLLATGVRQAYLVVSGVDSIRPFYLRCVPFVLFSDPEILARHLLIATEWHFKARHPTRVAEASLETGRKRFLLEFAALPSGLGVALIPQPTDRFPVIERTNVFRWGNPIDLANDQRTEAVTLFDAGAYALAAKHFNSAIYLLPYADGPWLDAGVALYNSGDVRGAVTDFEHAIKLAPRNPDAHANLAAALFDLGRTPEAEAELAEALRLDPRNARAQALVEIHGIK